MTRADTRTRILRACYAFLIPVARFLLNSGISFREFSEISRAAFVEVAGRDFGKRGRPTNISRVSAMTGIGRKEVKRVRELSKDYTDDPRIELSPLSDILQRWYTDPTYLDGEGIPRPLPYRDTDLSFSDLVRQCGGDVPPGAIKVELIRCGAVAEDADGNLIAKRRHVVPEAFDEKLVTSMTFGLRGLASTIAYNSNPNRKAAARFERVVRSNPVTNQSLEHLRPLLHERLTSISVEIDDLFASIDRQVQGVSKRVGVGLFFYEENDDQP